MHDNRADQEILEEAMENAYKIVMGVSSVEDMIEEKEEVVLPFDVREEEVEYDLTNLIDLLLEYYEGEEWYERCSKLVKLKKNGKENTIFVRRED